ncbi:FAD-dependent oxidoreductase, partial [Amycolatopsis sp. K13G38]
GGLSTAALLAKDEGKKVLVVEREQGTGGRMHHFKGDEIREAEDYLGPLRASRGRLAHSIPDLDAILDQKLLAGYSFELGMHDIVNGAQSRMVHILNHLGVPVEIVPLKACGFWHDGVLHQLERGSFPWFEKQDHLEMKRILGEMLRMPIEEVREVNRISLLDFVAPRTQNPAVREFFDILGAFTVGMNSARELSAGEFILATRMPMSAGLHFADGTLGQMGGESFMQMAFNLADVIRQYGGDVRTGQTVRTVLVEDGVAKGLRVTDAAGNTRDLLAETVVLNVPAALAVEKLIPREALPAEFAEHVRGLKSGGAFVPIYGLSKSVIDIPGMLFTKVPVDDPALPDGVMLGYEAHSLFVEGKAPDGKEIIECWIGLSTEELGELERAGKLVMLAETITDFMKASHPGFADALEWALFPAIDGVTSVQPTPEQAWDGMLDPKCPGVEGLYFVGDSVKNYGQFMDGVAYTALLATDAITGKNYLEEILPPYQREV